jgi:hypothetical protein
MKVARYEVPGQVRSAWSTKCLEWAKNTPRPGGTAEVGCAVNSMRAEFHACPNQASLRDAAVLRMLSRQ